MDHIKMGLIRSGNTKLKPLSSDGDLTDYLWPILREIIKTAIENGQNPIVEGCYVPFDWRRDFEPKYLSEIKYYCLVMSSDYVKLHFQEIKKYADIAEKRLDDSGYTMETALEENRRILEQCRDCGEEYILIADKYQVDIDL